MVSIDMETEAGRVEAFRRMLTIRHFERTAEELHTDGKLAGSSLHLCIGQEATAVGACAALAPEDYVTSTHRGHGHSIAKGIDLPRMMAELAGSSEGVCRGKGGTMHLADVDIGLLGANGIVGSGAPLATGAALASQLADDERVALAFAGDGAVAEGQVHEAINLAATWDLPVVFFVENNQYGEGTPAEKQHNVEQLSRSAEAYGIPGVTIDGMDVEAVFETVREARERALDGEGPTLIEAETYRYRGHFTGDPEPYRDEAEVERWRERDPVRTYTRTLVRRGELSAAEARGVESDVEADIEAAVSFALDAPMPDPEDAYEDMFADPVPEVGPRAELRSARVDGGAASRSGGEGAAPAPADAPTRTMREAINGAMHEELARDDEAFLIGEDVAEYGGVFNVTEGLLEAFGPDRVRDTPISEAAIVGAGVGAAAVGRRPIVEIMFCDFLGIAAEPMLNQMAKMRYMFGGQVDLPVTVRTTEGGGLGTGSQHSSTLHTWFAHLPGVKAVAPGTPAAAKGLLKSAVRSPDPVVFFENKTTYEQEGPVPDDDEFTVPLGRASVEREGADVTVVATQHLVPESLSVAEELAGEVDVEVLDLRSLYPLDTEAVVESVGKTGRLVVADESPLSFGTHAELFARIVEDLDGFYSLDAPLQRVGVPDTHVPFSPGLEAEVLPGAPDVRTAIERIV
jgi:pyruvate/2-oxoglutarate/acetoin dehydrogenase E1 component/TPP-dependent pyruvate/acetoin dehydrogenase alpha subunit